MLHDLWHYLGTGTPFSIVLLTLLLVDLLFHLKDWIRWRIAPRRCRLGFHTCSSCAIVMAVTERRKTPSGVQGREIMPLDLPPGLREEPPIELERCEDCGYRKAAEKKTQG